MCKIEVIYIFFPWFAYPLSDVLRLKLDFSPFMTIISDGSPSPDKYWHAEFDDLRRLVISCDLKAEKMFPFHQIIRKITSCERLNFQAVLERVLGLFSDCVLRRPVKIHLLLPCY